MVFDFHFHRERRLRKKQYTVVLSHSLYPLHSLAHPLPFFLCLSPSSFFFSFFSCSPLPLFLFSHSHQMFPARFPDARHWGETLKAASESSRGRENQYFSTSLWVMAVLRQNGDGQISRPTSLHGEILALILLLEFKIFRIHKI